MNKIIALLMLVVGVMANTSTALATDYYWVAAANSNWKVAANWATSSGGTGGAGIPTTGDRAIFDSLGVTNCTILSTVLINNIELRDGYTGSLIQDDNVGLLIYQDLDIDGGTFLGATTTSSRVTVVGDLNLSGGTFQANRFDVRLQGDLNKTGGVFNHNSGRFTFTKGTKTITVASGQNMDFYDIDFAPHSSGSLTATISGTINAEGLVRIDNSNGTVLLLGGKVECKADVDVSANGAAGNLGKNSTIFVFNGTSDQTITGHSTEERGRLGGVRIDKASGNLIFKNQVTITWYWTYLNGTLAPDTTASDNITFLRSGFVRGTFALHNVCFSGGIGANTYTLDNGDLTVEGRLKMTGPNYVRLNTGNINCKGDIELQNTNVGSSGTGWLKINGTGNQSITGTNGTPGQLCASIEVDKSAGTLSLFDDIAVPGNWKQTAGTIAADSSTVHFALSTTLNGGNMVNLGAVVLGNGNHYGTLLLTGGAQLSVRDLSYASISCVLDGDSIFVSGSLDVSAATQTGGGTGTIVLNGTTNQTITSSDTIAILPDLQVDKASGEVLLNGDLYVQADLNLTSGNIKSDSNNLVVFGGASTASGSSASFIDGPARRDGGACFSFPLGKGSTYGPLMIVGGSMADEVTAEYFDTAQTYGATLDSTLQDLSTCEFWTVTRTDLSTDLAVTPSYGTQSCNQPLLLSNYRVAGWDGSKWVNHGGIVTGDANGGTVESTHSISNYIAFTTAQAMTSDPAVTSWSGLTSTDWFNTLNWTNGLPDTARSAVIGDANFVGTNQPTVTGSMASANSILLGQGTATMTLTFDTDTLNIAHDLMIGTNGTFDVTIPSGSDPRLICLHGSMINAGTFNPGEGTVMLANAVSPQVITASNFYDLVLRAENGFDISFSGDLNIANDMHLDTGNIMGGTHAVTVGGIWQNSGANFDPGTGTVTLTAANSAADTAHLTSDTFFNLIIDAPGVTIKPFPSSTITVNNTFDLNQGSFDHQPNAQANSVVNGNGGSNSLLVGNTSNLLIRDTTFEAAFPGWESVSTSEQSVISYVSASPQTLSSAFYYGNLDVDGGGTKSWSGNTLVRGDLKNLSSSGNDLDWTTNNYQVQVNGNLEMASATLELQDGTFALGGNWISGKLTAGDSSQVGFVGNLPQTISQDSLTFAKVAMSKTSGVIGQIEVTLNKPISVTQSMDFAGGILLSDNTNILTYTDGVTLTGGNDKSFVNGPVRKIGDDAFTFPTGYTDGVAIARISPVRISAPDTITAALVAEYKLEEQTFGSTLATGVESVSDCEYWTVENEGTADEAIQVQLGWDDDFCTLSNPERAVLASWDGTQWIEEGVDEIEYGLKGSGGTSGILKDFSIVVTAGTRKPIVISIQVEDPQPYARLLKRLDGGYYNVANGQLNFLYEEQYNDQDQVINYRVLNELNQVVYTEADQALDALYGDNYNTMDVSCTGNGLNSGIYILEVDNEKNETYYLRFKQKKNFVCGQIPDVTLNPITP